MGFGIHTDRTSNYMRTESTTAGAQLKVGSSGVSGFVGLAQFKVSHTAPSGTSSTAVSGEAFTASFSANRGSGFFAQAPAVKTAQKTAGNPPSVPVFSVGAEASIAKVTVSQAVKLGPIRIEGTASVGVGASAGAAAGFSSKGFALGAKLGLGGTLGAGIRVSW